MAAVAVADGREARRQELVAADRRGGPSAVTAAAVATSVGTAGPGGLILGALGVDVGAAGATLDRLAETPGHELPHCFARLQRDYARRRGSSCTCARSHVGVQRKILVGAGVRGAGFCLV